jgi:hypothetical protein
MFQTFIALVLVFQMACGGSGPADSSEGDDVGGMALVGGVALERRGLLVVPADGGTAELRGLLDPSQVLWRGRLALPATVDAHPLGPAVVLRTSEGSVSVYDPARDILHAVGEIDGEPAWTGSEEGGVYYTPERILAITGRDGRIITPDGQVSWAAPATGGRVVALVAADASTRLMLWGEDVAEPEASQTVDASPPGLVTAWGEQLILYRAGASELVQLGLPDLEPTESVRLDARPFTLAASPSSHRIYAGLSGDAALIAVDRFSWRPHEQGRFRTPIRELRPSTAGDYILAFDGSVAWLLSFEAEDPTELDLEWRSDLPIGLPGGAVLGVRDGAMWMLTGSGSQATVIDAPASAWWLPVSWVPSRQPMQVARQTDDREPEGATEGPDGEPGDEPETAGQTEVQVVPMETAVPVVDVPPGFYAIAASSQRVGGVRDLSEALEGDGYPALVVPRRDEANEFWYRVMVGPYATREEADDILLQLRRERGIQGWVREVPQADLGAGDGEPR